MRILTDWGRSVSALISLTLHESSKAEGMMCAWSQMIPGFRDSWQDLRGCCGTMFTKATWGDPAPPSWLPQPAAFGPPSWLVVMDHHHPAPPITWSLGLDHLPSLSSPTEPFKPSLVLSSFCSHVVFFPLVNSRSWCYSVSSDTEKVACLILRGRVMWGVKGWFLWMS